MSTDLSGQKLGQYELRERLGRGGMADVYKAFQPGMERFVAIKVMLGHLATDEEFIERFRREARAVGQLRHAHIVNVFDFGIERDIYYMVMEFIRGDNLKAHIARYPNGLLLEDALRIASQLADALDYAHRAGMIHRDVKPANIMFTDDSLQHAILTDFGIAHILSQPGLTASGAMVGTPAYLSPEIAAGRAADARADLYGLGIILYEMLTGRVPYEADTPMAVIMKHVNAPLPSPSEYGRVLPESVEAIILKAMMKIPEERYQTAAEMKAAIDNARAGLADAAATSGITDRTERVVVEQSTTRPLHPPEETPTTMVERPAGRSPLLWVGLVAALAVIIVAALALFSGGGTPAPGVTDSPTDAPTQIAAAEVTEEATTAPTEAPSPIPTEAPSATATDEPTPAPTDTPSSTPTDEPTATTTPTDEPTATLTLTASPTDAPTATPTASPSPAPTEIPANMLRLREAGLLSGLTPLQDEIDSLFLADQTEAAQERLNQILDAEPDNIDALAARSMLNALIGDGDAALADADRAIELAPDNPLGYIARSEALQHWRIDDAAGSLAAAQQALALDPDNPEALWRASLAYAELDNEEAFLETLAAAEAAGAQGVRFIYFAGEYLYYAGQYESALPYLQKRYAANLSDTYSLRLLAEALLHLDRPEDAYAAVQQYPGVFTDEDLLVGAAYVAYRAGDYDQAREWAETARALSGEAYAAVYVLALVSGYGEGDYDAAMTYFDQLEGVEFHHELLSLEYGHALNLDRGSLLMEAGDYEAAIDVFQQALETVGHYPFVYEALADAYLAQGDTEAARAHLRLALDNTYDDPAEQRRLLERIRTLGAAGATTVTTADEPPETAQEISLLSGLTPLQDEIDTLLVNGEWDEARVRLTATLRQNPDNLEALVASAIFYTMTGEYARALHSADQAIRLDPESPLGYIARSHVLVNGGGSLRDALEAAQRALELDPGNPHALWRASLAYANLGEGENYIEYLNRAIEAGGQGFLFANFAGEYLYYQLESERALPYLEVWHQAFPDDVYATIFLAADLIRLDRVEDAYALIENFQGYFNGFEQLAWPAYVAYRAGEYDAARRWASRALALERNAPAANYVLGLVSWYDDHDLAAAMRHLDVLRGFPMFWDLLLNPENGHQVDYDRGRILAEAGQHGEAIQAYRRSLDADARPYTYEALADLYLMQDNVTAARLNLEAALEISQDPQEQARLAQRLEALE